MEPEWLPGVGPVETLWCCRSWVIALAQPCGTCGLCGRMPRRRV